MKRQCLLLLIGGLLSLPAWAGTTYYLYDVLGRLTAVQYDSGSPRIEYAYDAAGNFTDVSVVGASGQTAGICGSANGSLHEVAPTSGLCAVGTPSVVATSVSGHSWNCAGSSSTAYCLAARGYKLTATAGAGGTVSPPEQLVAYNDVATVQLTASAGYHVTIATSTCGGEIWGDVFTSGPITGSCAINASFSNQPDGTSYALSVNKTGTGLGLVTSNRVGIQCGGECAADYPAGTSVTLTAAPWGIATFQGWSGACTGTGACTVTMNQAQSVTARFALPPNTVNDVGRAVGLGLFFASGGDTPWVPDTTNYQSGGSSMRSGAIGDGQSSWLTTTVRGPATLLFHWKVSSEANFDTLSFYLDGRKPGDAEISGEVPWTQVGHDIPTGIHEIAWLYRKDGSNKTGSDAGWVDSLVLLPFRDVPASHWAVNSIAAIYNAGITTGCGNPSPDNYCPSQNVTREQMAVFLIRAKEGNPPANYCGTQAPFLDVPTTNTFCGHMKRMLELAITTGCGGGNYCPTQNVTREQMAAFLIRAKEGDPPANYCNGTSPFADVSPTSPFCGHIKRMLELNITTGCGNGNYCPIQNVTRDQMAAFLTKAFLGM